uniref:Protein lifeguard 1-like n=2 Tax=Hirondellea gigas TaxID=1518452 RepID=A0A2P2HYI3_9CRUS
MGFQPSGYGGGAPAGQPGMPPTIFIHGGVNPEPYNVSGSGAGGVYQPGTVGASMGSGRNDLPKLDDAALAATGLGNSFGDKAIRHAFVRKVYFILMIQLLFTVGVVALFTFHDGLKRFVQRNMWVYFMSYAVFLVTYITLVCCSGVRRKYPGNMIMLAVFTLAMSYMTGTISSFYDTKIVLMTLGITTVICFLISLFAMQTKYDFTGAHVYLFVLGMVLLIFGIIAIFTRSQIMQTVYSAGIALLFSMYLVYDTQRLMGGKKYELSPEEHVYGALTLYIDVVQIFMALLSLSKN